MVIHGKASPSPETFPLRRSSSEIVEIVRLNREITRSDVIEHTLLSQQTVHRTTAELVDQQLLALHEPKIDGRGKPSPRLMLHGEGAYASAIDINTSSIAIAHIDFAGKLLARSMVEVDSNNPHDVIRLAHAADLQQTSSLGLDPKRCGGIGVSMQGYRNSGTGSFTTPLPLQAWSHFAAAEEFAKVFGPHVFIENNATLGAIAESWVGAGERYKTFAYLSFNHGFGGGVILNGQPFFGAFGNAGEMSALFTEEELENRPAMSGLLDDLAADGIFVKNVKLPMHSNKCSWTPVQNVALIDTVGRFPDPIILLAHYR